MKNNRVLLMMLVALLAPATLAVAQARKAQPPKSLRLYVFDGGSLNIPDTPRISSKRKSWPPA
jgi:hypothetical protein